MTRVSIDRMPTSIEDAIELGIRKRFLRIGFVGTPGQSNFMKVHGNINVADLASAVKEEIERFQAPRKSPAHGASEARLRTKRVGAKVSKAKIVDQDEFSRTSTFTVTPARG